jgi:hypothetical protein
MDDTISQKVRSHVMYEQRPACSRMADVYYVHSESTTPLSCTMYNNLLGSYTTPELGFYRTAPLVTLAISARISLSASWSALPSSYFLWAFASDIYDLYISPGPLFTLYRCPVSFPHRTWIFAEDEQEVQSITRARKGRRRRRLTRVVPPAPVTVVVKRQYLLPHLQSPELSIVLQVSFLRWPFVIVYPQPAVSGTGAKPDISSVPIIFA